MKTKILTPQSPICTPNIETRLRAYTSRKFRTTLVIDAATREQTLIDNFNETTVM